MPLLLEDWDDYHAFTCKVYLASCIKLTSAINTALTSHLLFPAVFVAASAGVRVSYCLRPDGHTAFDHAGRLVMEMKTTAS